MKPIYKKEKFEGYTHRFIVRIKVDDDWRNDTNVCRIADVVGIERVTLTTSAWINNVKPKRKLNSST